MPFEYYKPHPELRQYISTYWRLTGGTGEVDVLMPDGCVDIIANLGTRLHVQPENVVLEESGIYLGGLITEAIYATLPADTNVIGIRFHPGCFPHFYSSTDLSSIADANVQVPPSYLPPLSLVASDAVSALDDYYLRQWKMFSHRAMTAVETIVATRGQAPIAAVANKSCLSARQLERAFNQHVGLPPKQFARIMRFNHAYTLLKNRPTEETLLGIAIEAGYHDHSHLTRELKRITLPKRPPEDGSL